MSINFIYDFKEPTFFSVIDLVYWFLSFFLSFYFIYFFSDSYYFFFYTIFGFCLFISLIEL